MGLRHEWEKAAEERGRAEGEARGRAETLLKQRRLRFGEPPAELSARIRSASVSELDRWAERVLTAPTIFSE